MISGFSVILDNEVLYCSNDAKYTLFEIVLFVQKLLKSINPRHNWRLKDIFLEGQEMGKERMLIKHVLTKDNKDLFYCISGAFKTSSREVRNDRVSRTSQRAVGGIAQPCRNAGYVRRSAPGPPQGTRADRGLGARGRRAVRGGDL